MTKEEGENGRDDMLIDDPQQVEDEGFNSNYLKVYYGKVSSKRHANAASGDNIFAPVERELVFDIDISDYDDARYCCSRADVCDCWPLMTIAIKVVDNVCKLELIFLFLFGIRKRQRGSYKNQ
ncbi:hypothetical protein CTI12_AA276540 [Artemisia annua]|uniref:Uncharacterized protein n=1 Tax=Artemisia annua TaxID=35608 RepID=A0A2U1NDI0_ARTAN|nr:hypothetical protein CTI12_AA276540 [Artemisia annua]